MTGEIQFRNVFCGSNDWKIYTVCHGSFLEPDGLSEGMYLGGCEIEYGLDKANDVITPFQTNQPEAIAVGWDAKGLNVKDIPKFDMLVRGSLVSTKWELAESTIRDTPTARTETTLNY